MELVRRARFANVFAFVYSPRRGTASARWGMEKAVPAPVASERLARLLALQEELQARGNGELVGTEFEVLLEGRDRQGQGRGRTPCNRIVHIPGAAGLEPGTYARVRITKGLPNSLMGELSS
jgi:tRNA-2-methylthio-N6-dimethylallyladenosine synthase